MRDDLELLESWRRGDRAAGNQLFERHFDSLVRFFRNKVNDGMEDLIQRTFLACIESEKQFRAEASFRSYLLGVARHILFRHYRERRRDGKTFDELHTSVHDLDPSPSMIAAKQKEQKWLLDALRQIPLDLQVALELHYWEEMPARQIADVLGIPPGTAGSRIRRGKEVLLRSLARSGSSSSDADTIEDLDEWARSLRALVLKGAQRP